MADKVMTPGGIFINSRSWPHEDDTLLTVTNEMFGIVSQYEMAVEEMAELIVEIQHAKREVLDTYDKSHLIEEVADVVLSVHQLSLILGIKEINKEIDRKLIRLGKRIEKKII